MRSSLQNRAEALFIYALYGFLKVLPPRWSSLLMGHLCQLGRLFPIQKKVLQRIHSAFPEKSLAERQRIAQGMWVNIGQTIGEFPHVHKLSAYQEGVSQKNLGGFKVSVEGSHHLAALKKEKRPVFFFSGHFANWEISSIVTQTFGFPIALMYRRPNNPFVDTLVRKTRQRVNNLYYLPKGAQGVKALLKLLHKGVNLGMLMDQKMNEGPLVPFFHKAVPTATALIDLCLKFDGVLIGVQVIREGPCSFRLIYHRPLPVFKTDKKKGGTYKTLVGLNKDLEAWVRMHPNQWFWLHNRG